LVEAGLMAEQFAHIEDLKKQIGAGIREEALSLGIISCA
jgi:hypothetical protein